MNNNGDGKIPMIGQEKRDKWKKILPELLAVILCLVLMGAGVSRKEGYHMDELLSFELANARYNPWIVPTQPEAPAGKGTWRCFLKPPGARCLSRRDVRFRSRSNGAFRPPRGLPAT